jgi:D-alanyl-D-alanine carboxypeptidase
MDQDTGRVIESKNKDKPMLIASITKIMTCILAIENGNLDEIVKVDESILKSYGSGIYISVGEEIKLIDLLYGLMLRSGNDCALMIAKSVSNDLDSFIDLMNKKAVEIGMKYTTFVNPHGLDEIDGGNISCSYDMALLQNYALNNLMYRKITSSTNYKSENYGVWVNKNKLLNQYSNCISGKTGYTKLAKITLVTSAKNDNLELTIVTLNCGGDFTYHKQLYKKNFNIYDSKLILKEGKIKILDYVILIDKDVYYFAKKEDLENSKLYIETDKEKEICNIYIVSKSTDFVGSFSFYIDENYNKYIDEFLSCLKDMFF